MQEPGLTCSEDQISVSELLHNTCDARLSAVKQVVVYGHGCLDPGHSLVSVLVDKLRTRRVDVLRGGFEGFESRFPGLCTRDMRTSALPTRILPFLFLGSATESRDGRLLRVSGVPGRSRPCYRTPPQAWRPGADSRTHQKAISYHHFPVSLAAIIDHLLLVDGQCMQSDVSPTSFSSAPS